MDPSKEKGALSTAGLLVYPPSMSNSNKLFEALLSAGGAFVVLLTVGATEGSGSFRSPGFINLPAFFSKGFLFSAAISGYFFSSFWVEVLPPVTDLSFLFSLYLSIVDFP